MINHLPEKLKNEIIQYCKLNNIEDINLFIIKLIKQSFTIEKFGIQPDFIENKNLMKEPEEQPKVVVEEKKEEVNLETTPDVIEIKPEETIIQKNEYQINLDLNKKEEDKKQIIDDDIYGEGKNGWFGGINLYDLIKRKK